MTQRARPPPNTPERNAAILAEDGGSSFGAYADVTGLVDRDVFLSGLAQQLEKGRALRQRQAVILIEIDRVRHINETQGYVQGDKLLAELENRLRKAVAGVAEISRIGACEYAVIPQSAFPTKAEAMAEAKTLATYLLEVVQQPVTGENVNWATASLGVAVAKGNPPAESLLQEAGLALTAAKADFGNQVRSYLPQMRVSAKDRIRLDTDLRAALMNDEFSCFAQPQVLMQDNEVTVTGYELLVRWNHPDRGLISPEKFISYAEKCGLIRQIDMWMLERACLLLASWASDPQQANRTLSVNVSALHFSDQDLADKIVAILTKTGAPAKQLILEVTETAIMDKVHLAKLTMKRLQRVGLSFALDDFGTGFSSLNLVYHLPFNQIKIDRSFVSRVPKDHRASVIVANMIRMSRALGVDVIAEGVETDDQMTWLLGNNCRAAQGYLFGKPEAMCHVALD